VPAVAYTSIMGIADAPSHETGAVAF